VTRQLEIDGVAAFRASYDQLMEAIRVKREALRAGWLQRQSASLGREAPRVPSALAALDQQAFGRRLWAKEDARSPLFRNVYWFLQGRRNRDDSSQASDHQVVYWITGWEGRTNVEYRKEMCRLLKELAHDADCGCSSCYGGIVRGEYEEYCKLREAGWKGEPFDEQFVKGQLVGESYASRILRVHLKLAGTEPTEPRPGEVESCDSP